jgi:single-stranded-DNA-specific exonuclease
VVTVDCGITAIEEVEVAKQLGLDIVITDHHTVPEQIPSAIAVVDAKRADSRYPFPELAGVGVAYKLLQALYRSIGKEGDIEAYLDLVALGTVADMVSLLGENRYLVKKGLEVLHNTKRPGLEEIARCAGVPISSVDSETISWVLAPRINAAGRLDHAGVGYHLLTTSSSDEARRLADLLERKNTERKSLTEEMLLRAREQINATDTDSPLLMVGGENFHSGVVGIVAGRLVDEFCRPVIVFERGREWSRGSARSIPNFDLVAAMSDCSDLLSRFGGHPMAAGFTIATENLDLFKARLVEIASRQISSFEIRHLISIDADVPVSLLGGDTYKMIQQLAPFGNGNPYPVFIARDIRVGEYRLVGGRGEHLKLRLIDDGTAWNGIGFKMGRLIAEVAPRMDIVFNLEVNLWGGGETLQLKILDFAPAT